jgi:hypothetical protein
MLPQSVVVVVVVVVIVVVHEQLVVYAKGIRGRWYQFGS